MYVSHVAEDGRIEEVADHLREVAEMAAEFARPFGPNRGPMPQEWRTTSASIPRNSRTASYATGVKSTTPRRGLLCLISWV